MCPRLKPIPKSAKSPNYPLNLNVIDEDHHDGSDFNITDNEDEDDEEEKIDPEDGRYAEQGEESHSSNEGIADQCDRRENIQSDGLGAEDSSQNGAATMRSIDSDTSTALLQTPDGQEGRSINQLQVALEEGSDDEDLWDEHVLLIPVDTGSDGDDENDENDVIEDDGNSEWSSEEESAHNEEENYEDSDASMEIDIEGDENGSESEISSQSEHEETVARDLLERLVSQLTPPSRRDYVGTVVGTRLCTGRDEAVARDEMLWFTTDSDLHLVDLNNICLLASVKKVMRPLWTRPGFVKNFDSKLDITFVFKLWLRVLMMALRIGDGRIHPRIGVIGCGHTSRWCGPGPVALRGRSG
jgi:hypothetical protein